MNLNSIKMKYTIYLLLIILSFYSCSDSSSSSEESDKLSEELKAESDLNERETLKNFYNDALIKNEGRESVLGSFFMNMTRYECEYISKHLVILGNVKINPNLANNPSYTGSDYEKIPATLDCEEGCLIYNISNIESEFHIHFYFSDDSGAFSNNYGDGGNLYRLVIGNENLSGEDYRYLSDIYRQKYGVPIEGEDEIPYIPYQIEFQSSNHNVTQKFITEQLEVNMIYYPSDKAVMIEYIEYVSEEQKAEQESRWALEESLKKEEIRQIMQNAIKKSKERELNQI